MEYFVKVIAYDVFIAIIVDFIVSFIYIRFKKSENGSNNNIYTKKISNFTNIFNFNTYYINEKSSNNKSVDLVDIIVGVIFAGIILALIGKYYLIIISALTCIYTFISFAILAIYFKSSMKSAIYIFALQFLNILLSIFAYLYYTPTLSQGLNSLNIVFTNIELFSGTIYFFASYLAQMYALLKCRTYELRKSKEKEIIIIAAASLIFLALGIVYFVFR